ncbi:MAG: YibE/F family protein [Actinomycetes bacterium]
MHGRDLDEAFDPALRRRLTVIVGVVALATLVGVALLWPGAVERKALGALGVPRAWFDGTVTEVERFPCPGEAGSGVTTTTVEGLAPEDQPFAGTEGLCVNVSFRLQDGPDRGEVRSVELYDVGELPAFRQGQGVVLSYLPDAAPEFQYSLADRERDWPLALLAVGFAVLVVVQGRLRGLAALAGLVASIGVIVVFVLPALVQGSNPVLVAVVASSLIAFLALYLAHGFHPLTTVALLGTLAALVLVVVLSWAFTGLTTLSGLVTEDAQYIRAFGGNLSFPGLVLAGIILGALGAIDDMTVTQASAVAELRAANPDISYADLYRGAIRIGRDHVASTVNTLALAYAGASLPLLLLFVQSSRPLGGVLASEVVATELVRTLVGSIGLVAAVPITTLLAARLVVGRRGSPEVAADPNGGGPADAPPDDEHVATGSPTQDDWDRYVASADDDGAESG